MYTCKYIDIRYLITSSCKEQKTMFKKLTSGLKLGRDWWANTQKVLLSGDEPTNIVTNVSGRYKIS